MLRYPSTSQKISTYLIFGLALPLAILLIVYSYNSSRAPEVYRKTQFLMGTIVEISVAGVKDSELSALAVESAFKEIDRIEDKFSSFSKESVVSRLNRLKEGEMLGLDDETLYVIEESIRYNRLTDGAFDITVKPLVDLWGFSKAGASQVPSNEQIAECISGVGSEKIIVDRANKRIGFTRDGMKIDLGGIAKGYAADRAVEVLKESGISSGIVNAGGDMRCFGKRSPGRMWRVGIQHPRIRDRLIAELDIEDKAIDTSGDYEKFFKIGEEIFSHIIDPKSGIPVGSNPTSATIIAKTSMEADALATALMVLGRERGIPILEKNFDVDWLVITERPDKTLEIEKSERLERAYGFKER